MEVLNNNRDVMLLGEKKISAIKTGNNRKEANRGESERNDMIV